MTCHHFAPGTVGTGLPGHQTTSDDLFNIYPPATWDSENTLRPNIHLTNVFCPTLPLSPERIRNIFLFPFPCVVCQIFCCPILDTVFRLLMPLCPQNTSVNVIDSNSGRNPLQLAHLSCDTADTGHQSLAPVAHGDSLSWQPYCVSTPHSRFSILLKCSHSRQSQMPFKSFKVVTFEQVLGFDDGDSDGINIRKSS